MAVFSAKRLTSCYQGCYIYGAALKANMCYYTHCPYGRLPNLWPFFSAKKNTSAPTWMSYSLLQVLSSFQKKLRLQQLYFYIQYFSTGNQIIQLNFNILSILYKLFLVCNTDSSNCHIIFLANYKTAWCTTFFVLPSLERTNSFLLSPTLLMATYSWPWLNTSLGSSQIPAYLQSMCNRFIL